MTGVAIFSGPSLSDDDRCSYPAFDFRPPVAAGDVLRAVRDGARTMAIIDGVFADCMAVHHKEILYALSGGTAVYGAASMGALRAAELDCYGMIGVGEIYLAYHRGDLIEDEAVALVHGPADTGYRPLTLPTVDALATIAALVSRGQLAANEAVRLRCAVRDTHFSQRTWRSVVSLAMQDKTDRRRCLSILRHGRVERKRLDALMLLDRLVADDVHGVGRTSHTAQPPMTPAFRALMARVS